MLDAVLLPANGALAGKAEPPCLTAAPDGHPLAVAVDTLDRHGNVLPVNDDVPTWVPDVLRVTGQPDPLDVDPVSPTVEHRLLGEHHGDGDGEGRGDG